MTGQRQLSLLQSLTDAFCEEKANTVFIRTETTSARDTLNLKYRNPTPTESRLVDTDSSAFVDEVPIAANGTIKGNNHSGSSVLRSEIFLELCLLMRKNGIK